ncbi:MAG: phosphoribosylaminoimidazole carboxylase [Verrucomicrobiota bacterium]
MLEIPSVTNLLENLPAHQEQFRELVSAGTSKLEHIVSNGKASHPDFWYDQDSDEWVALIQGEACLEFASGLLPLRMGDCITIPAHLKHRVASVSDDAIWLALHFDP